jgi:hypothetical protein
MAGYFMPLAAFLVEPHPRAPALQKIVLDPHIMLYKSAATR